MSLSPFSRSPVGCNKRSALHQFIRCNARWLLHPTSHVVFTTSFILLWSCPGHPVFLAPVFPPQQDGVQLSLRPRRHKAGFGNGRRASRRPAARSQGALPDADRHHKRQPGIGHSRHEDHRQPDHNGRLDQHGSTGSGLAK